MRWLFPLCEGWWGQKGEVGTTEVKTSPVRSESLGLDTKDPGRH